LVSNPCNVATGSKYQVESDYNSQSPFPLRLERAYNSSSVAYSASQIAKLSVGFGLGWSWSYYKRVEVPADASSTWLALRREDGRVLHFDLVGGVWQAEPDAAGKLAELKDTGGVRTGWEYLSPEDDTLETYDSAGRLVALSNRAGLSQTLTYSDGTAATGQIEGTTAPLPAGLLVRVTDHFGRSLSFGYDALRRVVRLTEPSNSEIAYAYDAANRLVSVTYPDGRARTYHYENTQFTAALTGITDENGTRFATYAYSSTARVALTEHAGSVNRYSFTYGPLFSPTSTVVTNPFNVARTYGLGISLGDVKVASIGGSSCPSCGPAAQTFDANGKGVSGFLCAEAG